jgi:hypothetical protein
MEPISMICCGGCCLLLILLLAGGGSTHSQQTIVMTPGGPQTVSHQTKRSMSVLEVLVLIILGLIAVPILAGILYVWANNLG